MDKDTLSLVDEMEEKKRKGESLEATYKNSVIKSEGMTMTLMIVFSDYLMNPVEINPSLTCISPLLHLIIRTFINLMFNLHDQHLQNTRHLEATLSHFPSLRDCLTHHTGGCQQDSDDLLLEMELFKMAL